jgi:hypothetical protein
MRNVHIKYSSVHQICKLVRVRYAAVPQSVWPIVLQFCRRPVFLCPSNQTATVEHRVSCRYSFIVLWLRVFFHFPFVITDFFSSALVGFVVDKMALSQVLSPFVPVFLVSTIPPFHIHSSVHLRHNMTVSLDNSLKKLLFFLSFHVHSFLCNLSFNP